MTEEEELLEQLRRLNMGETVTINVNGENIQYTRPVENVTCSEHYYVEDRPEGDIPCVKCKWCVNGRMYDPREEVLKDGKLIKLGVRL